MYTRNKVPNFKQETRFQLRRLNLGYQFETLIYLASSLVFFWNESPRNPLDGYAKAASNNFNGWLSILSPVDSFQAVLAQTSFKERL
jgi:hypothetical protein